MSYGVLQKFRQSQEDYYTRIAGLQLETDLMLPEDRLFILDSPDLQKLEQQMFLLAQSEKDRDALNAQGAAYRLRFDIQFKTVVELRKFIESHPKYSPLADGRRLFDWLHANNGGEINARTLHMGFIALHGLDEAVLIQLPCIDRQPEAQSIRAGEPVKFEVVASGTALRYQWYKDGEAIVWATTPSYITLATEFSDGGMYSVKVSNAAGECISKPATLRMFTK